MINQWDQRIEVGKKEFSRAVKKAFKAFKEEEEREREEVADAGSNKRASSAIFDRLGDSRAMEDQFLPSSSVPITLC